MLSTDGELKDIEKPLRLALLLAPSGQRSDQLQLESINDEVRSFYRLLEVQRLLDCLQVYGCLLPADAG